MNVFFPFESIKFNLLEDDNIFNFNLYVSNVFDKIKTFLDKKYQVTNNLYPNYINIINAIDKFYNFILSNKNICEPMNLYFELIEKINSDEESLDKNYEYGITMNEIKSNTNPLSVREYVMKCLMCNNSNFKKAIIILKHVFIGYKNIDKNMIMLTLIGLKNHNDIKFKDDNDAITFIYQNNIKALKFNLDGEISGLLENRLSTSITKKDNFINYMVMFDYINPQIVIKTNEYSIQNIYITYESFLKKLCFSEFEISFKEDNQIKIINTNNIRQLFDLILNIDLIDLKILFKNTKDENLEHLEAKCVLSSILSDVFY